MVTVMDLTDILVLYIAGLLMSRAIFSTWLNPMTVFFLCWIPTFLVDWTPVMAFYSLSRSTLQCAAGLAIGFFAGGLVGNTLAPRGALGRRLDLAPWAHYITILTWLLALGVFGSILFIIQNPIALAVGGQFERMEKAGSLDIFFYFYHGVVFPALVTTITVAAALHGHLTSRPATERMRPDVRKLCRRLLPIVIASMATLMLVDLLTMGRMKTITAFMAVIPAYTVISPRMSVSRRGVLLILLGGGIVFAFIVGVTAWRVNATGSDVYRSLLLYWTGPVRFFDAYLTTGGFGIPMHGRFTLMAFEGFILHSISFFPVIHNFIPELPQEYFLRQNAMDIGPSSNYNAFGSIMLDPYYDFGLIGVVLLGLVVGVVVVYLYQRSRYDFSPAVLALATVAMAWVIWSPVTWGGGWQVTTGAVPFWIFFIEFLLRRWRPRRSTISSACGDRAAALAHMPGGP